MGLFGRRRTKWQDWQRIAAPGIMMAIDRNMDRDVSPFNSMASREIRPLNDNAIEAIIRFQSGESVVVAFTKVEIFNSRESATHLVERVVREAVGVQNA